MVPAGAGYDSRSRRAAAERRRSDVLRAGLELFLTEGYRTTTIKAIAGRAGVSAELIYKGFGSKAALAKALWDVTLAGDDAPLAMSERPELRAVFAAPDLPAALAGYAVFVRRLWERLAPLLAVLVEAGADAAELRGRVDEERLAGVGHFVARLAAAGLVEPAGPDAVDVCWLLTGPDPYARLVAERGWTPARYQAWLAAELHHALTGRASGQRARQ